MVFGISVRFLFMVVTANLKASSSTLMGSFSRVSKIPPAGREGAKVLYKKNVQHSFPRVVSVVLAVAVFVRAVFLYVP